jgi:carbon starvation protein CstA
MITFVVSILVLILGYFFYGRVVERAFGSDSKRDVPAYTMQDGVDFVPMPTWKIFMIQFLNIAGRGPLFGAIMGIMYGPAAFLWIVLGTIFGGAVHDYLSGMLSLRNGGASLPEIVGKYLGVPVKYVMRIFSLFLMILVGAVFVSGPAGLLANLTNGSISVLWWTVIVFAYYILATLLPIDKLIGKIYPIFGAVLLFMAFGIMIAMFVNNAPIAELSDGLHNRQDNSILPIFPMMFVSIACGAISGFHATQSPMMARCLKNERYAKPVFFGAMVSEGIVALIWAAAASSFFGSIEGLQSFVGNLASTANKPAEVVNIISFSWLGKFGGVLAILGVIAAPLTSGDTALRSARLIAADFLKISQKTIVKRLLISLPIFVLTFFILMINFDVLWRYFAWCNQTLAVFTLWAITVYMFREKKNYWLSFIPAIFMTLVSVSYIVIAPEGFNLPIWIGYLVATIVTIFLVILFYIRCKRSSLNNLK